MTKKVALITGGAKRIGAAIARHLHQQGFDILLHYHRSTDAAEQLCDKLNQSRPHSIYCLSADLTDHQQLQTLAKDAVEHWGRLNVLVNNASSFYPTPIGDIDPSSWDALIGSNAKGAFFLSQSLAPALKKSGGCIVNLLDIYAQHPLKQHSVYCIAKAAASMMTRSLAQELAPTIRVNGIAPGAILWPENIEATQQQRIIDSIPLGRLGHPSDIAQAVYFLIAQAPYITGQIICVDGGRGLK